MPQNILAKDDARIGCYLFKENIFKEYGQKADVLRKGRRE